MMWNVTSAYSHQRKHLRGTFWSNICACVMTSEFDPGAPKWTHNVLLEPLTTVGESAARWATADFGKRQKSEHKKFTIHRWELKKKKINEETYLCDDFTATA